MHICVTVGEPFSFSVSHLKRKMATQVSKDSDFTGAASPRVGRGSETLAFCPDLGKFHTRPSAGQFLRDHLSISLLAHFARVETEAWASILPNDELNRFPLPLSLLSFLPKVKGDYNQRIEDTCTLSHSSVIDEASISGQHQRTRAHVPRRSTSP